MGTIELYFCTDFLSPHVMTGDALCPDLLLITAKEVLYILESMVGYEISKFKFLERNYHPLTCSLKFKYAEVNRSVSCLNFFWSSFLSFMEVCTSFL